MKKEYMLHIWGGAFNEGNPLHGKDHYYYFDTECEIKHFSASLKKYEKYGLMRDMVEGVLKHKRTVAFIDFKYNNEVYSIEYDFGYEYPEESARFAFFENNHSCDCNRSMFISRKYPEFEEMGCGEKIDMIKFDIKYLD